MPRAHRWMIRTMSWIVPPASRRSWRARWESQAGHLWALRERGELPSISPTAWIFQAACREALSARLGEVELLAWLRSPGFVFACGTLTLLLMGIASGGFPMVHYLIGVAASLHRHPGTLGRYDPRWDAIFRYTFPMVLAALTCLMLIATSRLPLRRYSWRYWCFLSLKTGFLLFLVCLSWVEGGAYLRRQLHNETLRELIGCILFFALFMAAAGWAILWSISDQRRRCHVCLRRMTMPVSVGSWSSVLDPAATELVCRSGHGSLCLSENGLSQCDRWIQLDASWRGLFEQAEQR